VTLISDLSDHLS